MIILFLFIILIGKKDDEIRVQRKIVFLSVLLMAIGFAAVSTTLYLNGTIGIGTNNDDFDVYFSKAVENGVENNGLIQDKTHISFRTELSKINEKYTLEYDVTNASKQYDASIVINCTGGNEYLRVENKFNVLEDLKAREIRSGKLTLTVIKSVFEETEVSINCEIRGSAKERTEAGGETIDKEQVDYLKQAESSSNSIYLGHELDRTKVESITLKNTKDVPEGVESWDVSNSGNGSILAYTLDEDNNELLELYIGQNGGVNANPNSSYLFAIFMNLTSINGLEFLDTSQVIDMNNMFCSSRSLINLDLSSFDTRNVSNMENMFLNCQALTSLNVKNWNTENVTNIGSMFAYCEKLSTLDLHNWNTSNVTSINALFSGCSNLTILDLSHFDTNKCTKMNSIFLNCRALSSLNVKNWNTENVTSMFGMFSGCSSLIALDLSHFDTSKVKDMGGMFNNCPNLITEITIKGVNCEEYYGMFADAAMDKEAKITVHYTEDASSLVDQMIATKSSGSNVVKGKNMSNLVVTVQDDEIIASVAKGYEGQIITLSTKMSGSVTSFKLNGVLIEGNTFIMPNENVIITDVVKEESEIRG